MSRITPPTPASPSGSPDDPNKRPAALGPQPATGANKPGMPAQKPNVTTPKVPTVGASSPPTAAGQPASKIPDGGSPKIPGAVTPGHLAAPTGAAAAGQPAVEELKGRPLGRILTKMGKVSREQVV